MGHDRSKFEVVLRVPATHVAKIEAHQKARISIDSFPYQQFGYFTGNVINVDQTSTGVIGNLKSDSVIVRTTLGEPENRSRFPAGEIHILPGMKVKSYIRTRKDSIALLLYEKIFTNDLE